MARLDVRFIPFLLITALSTPALAGDVSVKLDSGSGFSVKDNTGAIERLRIDEATGNVSRNGALFIHTTGSPSGTFVGAGAGNVGPTGYGNTGFGRLALAATTTGNRNTAAGSYALSSNTTGSSNTATGFVALQFSSVGHDNTATGARALVANTTGNHNTATGSQTLVLNTTGNYNTATGSQALFSNTTGFRNTAMGSNALSLNTTGTGNTAVGYFSLFANTGVGNTAVGFFALRSNTTSYWNSALGSGALEYTTTGPQNSAFGAYALGANTTGSGNSAFGSFSLRDNTTGLGNAAFGRDALYANTTGSRNVAVGRGAGSAQTTGNDNIYLANLGLAAESGQIKLGTVGTHTGAHVAGIHGATSSGGIAVLVNASGTLGTTTSSARFKRDVEDLGDASELLMRLRPVRFHYREQVVGAEEAKTAQYGLIAEEVAEVAPELVAPDAEGRPYSVKYHVLPALLLNELQRERRANLEQQRTIEAQRELITSFSARLELLEGRASR